MASVAWLRGTTSTLAGARRFSKASNDGRVRRRSREVARAIQAQASQPEALKNLRDSVEKLEDQNRQLQERLRKLEAKIQ